jgi:putative peptide zinc metalloprotease protein
MICRACRRQFGRTSPACPSCGSGRRGGNTTFDLVLADHARVPVVSELTIGRAAGNAVQLLDPSVSRTHARLVPSDRGRGPVLQDAGSSHGTRVDGRRLEGPLTLRDGARIALGDHELTVERRRHQVEAGRTMLVPPGASVVIPSYGEPLGPTGSRKQRVGECPRLRSGYALKRLDASEGSQRWVLKDLVGRQAVRLADADADLLQLLDGRHSIPDLVWEAEQRFGRVGGARLARLLADLGSRGLLAGAPAAAAPARSGKLARLLQPRRKVWTGAGDLIERVYVRGGWLLFTRPVLGAIVATAATGLLAFGYLVMARYGTPFVVARHVGLGGIIFIVGRVLFAMLHEAAHALTMASFGRRVGDAGIKTLLIYPFTFVDTSDAWFEPRRRRIAVSAAGPVCDLFLGGAFSLACLLAPAGTLRDICFQLAFGSYYGALFNLNPLLERDGYQILVDVVRRPGLRRLALEQLRRRLAGGAHESDSRLLGGYALFVLAWMVVTADFAATISLHYLPALTQLVPRPAAWAMLAAIWVGLLAPALGILLPALWLRLGKGRQ